MCTYSKRDIKRILSDNGWSLHHHRGSHAVYRNTSGQHLTIPVVKCNKMIMQRLIKEHGLIVG